MEVFAQLDQNKIKLYKILQSTQGRGHEVKIGVWQGKKSITDKCVAREEWSVTGEYIGRQGVKVWCNRGRMMCW